MVLVSQGCCLLEPAGLPGGMPPPPTHPPHPARPPCAGPNATTWLLPAEVVPTEMRAMCHGFAAAVGKAGALVAGVVFNMVDDRGKCEHELANMQALLKVEGRAVGCGAAGASCRQPSAGWGLLRERGSEAHCGGPCVGVVWRWLVLWQTHLLANCPLPSAPLPQQSGFISVACAIALYQSAPLQFADQLPPSPAHLPLSPRSLDLCGLRHRRRVLHPHLLSRPDGAGPEGGRQAVSCNGRDHNKRMVIVHLLPGPEGGRQAASSVELKGPEQTRCRCSALI